MVLHTAPHFATVQAGQHQAPECKLYAAPLKGVLRRRSILPVKKFFGVRKQPLEADTPTLKYSNRKLLLVKRASFSFSTLHKGTMESCGGPGHTLASVVVFMWPTLNLTSEPYKLPLTTQLRIQWGRGESTFTFHPTSPGLSL